MAVACSLRRMSHQTFRDAVVQQLREAGANARIAIQLDDDGECNFSPFMHHALHVRPASIVQTNAPC